MIKKTWWEWRKVKSSMASWVFQTCLNKPIEKNPGHTLLVLKDLRIWVVTRTSTSSFMLSLLELFFFLKFPESSQSPHCYLSFGFYFWDMFVPSIWGRINFSILYGAQSSHRQILQVTSYIPKALFFISYFVSRAAYKSQGKVFQWGWWGAIIFSFLFFFKVTAVKKRQIHFPF